MRRLSKIMLILMAFMVAVPTFAFAWNRCGDKVTSIAQFKKELKQAGIYDDLQRQVSKNKKKYHFTPIDGMSYTTWFNTQLDILPLKKSTRVPNSGCGGNAAHTVADKWLPGHRPVVVALPTQYTASQVASKKGGKFDTKVTINATYVAQSTCDNLALRVKIVKVIGYVDKEKTKPPKKPTVPPATPETPKSPPPATVPPCTIVNNGTNNGTMACESNVYICSANVAYNGDQAICSLYMNCVADQTNTWDSVQKTCVKEEAPPVKTCKELGTCPEVPPEKPLIVATTEINDVYIGMTKPNFCASVSVPGTHTATLVFSPKYGSFTAPTGSATIEGGTVKFTVSGSERVCAIYIPPSEVPLSGKETLKVLLRDNVTGVSADPEVQEFLLKVLPPNPE